MTFPKELSELFADKDQAVDYIKRQRTFFLGIGSPNCDFGQWIALKLSCSRSRALRIVEWSDEA